MKRLEVDDTPITGLKRVRRTCLADARGFLARLFCADELRDAGWDSSVAQINHTRTVKRGSIRGLHFQHPPKAEKKLVHCLRGEVWDVAVDLRRGSPTFLQWHAERLSADNGVALLIPEGFAHGFQTLADDVEMLYVHSVAYSAADEGGVHPRDARVAIAWPLPIEQLSPRDDAHSPLAPDFQGLAA